MSNAIVDAVENSPWIKSSVSGALVYNTIDDMKSPHEGIFANVTTEVAGLGGDAQFVKLTARGSYYHTLSEELDVVGILSGGGGHVASYGGDGLRVFDQFQSNDRMIRGFEYGGIGPYDADGDNDHLGGTTYFNASAEAQFPLPVIPESFGLRAAVFADAATLYGNDIDVEGVNVAGRRHAMACVRRRRPDLGVSVRPAARRLRRACRQGRHGRGAGIQLRHVDPLLIEACRLSRPLRPGRHLDTVPNDRSGVLRADAPVYGGRGREFDRSGTRRPRTFGIEIAGIASASEGGEGMLVYIEGRGNAKLAETVEAAAVFCTAETAPRVKPGVAVLVTRKPQAAFATIGRLMFPAAASPQALTGETGISSGAHVDPAARLEQGVVVEAGAVIGPGVAIGAGTIVAPNAVIGKLCQIGRDCYVGPGATCRRRSPATR